jgi:hypothetical protein
MDRLHIEKFEIVKFIITLLKNIVKLINRKAWVWSAVKYEKYIKTDELAWQNSF